MSGERKCYSSLSMSKLICVGPACRHPDMQACVCHSAVWRTDPTSGQTNGLREKALVYNNRTDRAATRVVKYLATWCSQYSM